MLVQLGVFNIRRRSLLFGFVVTALVLAAVFAFAVDREYFYERGPSVELRWGRGPGAVGRGMGLDGRSLGPECIEGQGTKAYIADTFNQRVFEVDLLSGEVRAFEGVAPGLLAVAESSLFLAGEESLWQIDLSSGATVARPLPGWDLGLPEEVAAALGPVVSATTLGLSVTSGGVLIHQQALFDSLLLDRVVLMTEDGGARLIAGFAAGPTVPTTGYGTVPQRADSWLLTPSALYALKEGEDPFTLNLRTFDPETGELRDSFDLRLERPQRRARLVGWRGRGRVVLEIIYYDGSGSVLEIQDKIAVREWPLEDSPIDTYHRSSVDDAGNLHFYTPNLEGLKLEVYFLVRKWRLNFLSLNTMF